MKLSVKRKRGCVHVVASRVVRVVQPHSVPGRGSPRPGARDTKNEAGDLAVEVVEARSKNLVGYSYLSGDAIQYIHYEANSDWFETEERVGRITLPSFKGPTAASVIEKISDVFKKAKEKNVVSVLEYKATDLEDMQHAAEGVASIWAMCEVEKPGHLIAHLFFSKKHGILIHFQPPDQAQDLCVTNFQAELLKGLL